MAEHVSPLSAYPPEELDRRATLLRCNITPRIQVIMSHIEWILGRPVTDPALIDFSPTVTTGELITSTESESEYPRQILRQLAEQGSLEQIKIPDVLPGSRRNFYQLSSIDADKQILTPWQNPAFDRKEGQLLYDSLGATRQRIFGILREEPEDGWYGLCAADLGGVQDIGAFESMERLRLIQRIGAFSTSEAQRFHFADRGRWLADNLGLERAGQISTRPNQEQLAQIFAQISSRYDRSMQRVILSRVMDLCQQGILAITPESNPANPPTGPYVRFSHLAAKLTEVQRAAVAYSLGIDRLMYSQPITPDIIRRLTGLPPGPAFQDYIRGLRDLMLSDSDNRISMA